jgi:hypothetical protein
VVNEVKYTYNGYGQLTKDEQDHDSAVDGSTLNVSYAYSESTGSNHSRLTSMTYPNTRVFYPYYTHTAASTQQDEIAAAFSQIRQWTDAATTGKIYSEINQAGHSIVSGVRNNDDAGWLGNDTFSNRDSGTADQYAEMDLFGRLIGAKVTDAAAKIV